LKIFSSINEGGSATAAAASSSTAGDVTAFSTVATGVDEIDEPRDAEEPAET